MLEGVLRDPLHLLGKKQEGKTAALAAFTLNYKKFDDAHFLKHIY